MESNYTEKIKLSDEKLKNATGGNSGMRQYTCVNPACSEYLIYLQFQPSGNKCQVCGQLMGIIN